jgi:hypothetical protein
MIQGPGPFSAAPQRLRQDVQAQAVTRTLITCIRVSARVACAVCALLWRQSSMLTRETFKLSVESFNHNSHQPHTSNSHQPVTCY